MFGPNQPPPHQQQQQEQARLGGEQVARQINGNIFNQVFAMHQQRDREEAVLAQMSRITVSPQQQQLDPAWSMAALRTDVAELARQTAGEAAVVARMAELELGGGAGLRAAMSGLQLEPHQAAMEAPPNPSYTEYMMQRAGLEAASTSTSRSPLFLSALASHALQLGPQ